MAGRITVGHISMSDVIVQNIIVFPGTIAGALKGRTSEGSKKGSNDWKVERQTDSINKIHSRNVRSHCLLPSDARLTLRVSFG